MQRLPIHLILRVLPITTLLVAGAQCGLAADPIVHQIALPQGMTWCSDTIITGVLTEVNKYRATNGLPALQADPLGMKDAELRATQFAAYMVTNPPGSAGFNPHQGWDTTAASIGYQVLGENLAYMASDPAYIVGLWQGDTLHRAAMLDREANVAGTSCVIFNGTAYTAYEPGLRSGSSTPPTTPTDETAAFLNLLNAYRAQNGLNPVEISPTLQSAAAWMANDMATKNYASHTDSLGRSVGARLAAFGYTYTPYGENIAGGFGDAQSAFDQWKNACDADATGACTYAHRKNMLNPSFTATGIGRAYNANSAYGWYWVNDFGGFRDSTSTPPPAPSPAPVISSFIATPSSVSSGGSATLSWSVSGATSVSLDNGIGTVPATGSKAVTPAQTTTYRLTASNAAGSVVATVTVSVGAAADTQPPTAPSLTSATATSDTRVSLVWRASTDNVGVAGYEVLRNGSPAGTVSGSVLTFTDAVAANTRYTYTVRAFDLARNYSAASNAVQATTPIAQAGICPAPANNAFTGCYYNNLDLSGSPALVRTDTSINFDWLYTPPSPAVSSPTFSVRWQGNFTLSAGTYSFTASASDGVRLYIDGNIALDKWRDQAQTTYTVQRVLAAGNHLIVVEYYQRTGIPRISIAWKNTTAASSLPAITSFTATPSTITAGQSATLSWSTRDASSVSIDNGVGGVSSTASKIISPLQTTTYKLTATNAAGSATASVTVTVNGVGGQDTQAPTAPVITSATARSATAVELKWTAASDNTGVAGYKILRNGAVLGSVSGSTLSYTDASAAASTTYGYSVRAFDAAGNYSPAGNTVTVTTPASVTPTGCTPGTNVFTGCYYNSLDLSGTPVLIRTDNRIDFDWTFTKPSSALSDAGYSVRWEGTFSFETATYTFNATTSDGMRVYIDGQLILDRWRDQPVYSYAVQRAITAGVHLVTVEYYERTRSAVAKASWQKN